MINVLQRIFISQCDYSSSQLSVSELLHLSTGKFNLYSVSILLINVQTLDATASTFL